MHVLLVGLAAPTIDLKTHGVWCRAISTNNLLTQVTPNLGLIDGGRKGIDESGREV